jgi:hypothetical protein
MDTLTDTSIERRNARYKNDQQNFMSYDQYRSLVRDLLAEHKVTGPEQTEALLQYSLLNEQRMNRLDKHYTPSDNMKNTMQNAPSGCHMVVIAEGWCGDAAQIIPALHSIAILGKDWKFSVVLRDENEEWMNLYLTNQAKAIPIAILFNTKGEYITHWGPRPAEAIQLIQNAKANGVPADVWKVDLHKWYATNKQMALESEWKTIVERL